MWDLADQFKSLHKQLTVGNDGNKAGQNYFHVLMWLRSRLEKFYRLHYYLPQKPFQKVLGSQNKPAGKLFSHVTHQKQYGFIVNGYREAEH